MCLLSYVSSQVPGLRSSLLTSKDQDSPETRLAWPGGLARREARTSQMERFQSYCGPGRAWREIVFKWTIIKTLLRLRVLSGFSETNHTKWFLVRLLKISRKNLNSSFARIITRSQREREREEKYPGLLMTGRGRQWEMSLLPSDVTYLGKLLSLTVRFNLVIYYSYNSLCRNYLSLVIWVI